jgi:hypothetical protein
MDIAKKLFEKATEGGKVKEHAEFLKLNETVQVEVNGEMVEVRKPTGPHRIKIVSEKMGKGKNGFTGEEQDELQMVVLEGSKQKLWNVAVKGKNGDLNYLIERLMDVEIGDELVVESKKSAKGQGYYTDIQKVASSSKGLPTIQLDDTPGEGDLPNLDGEEDISPEDIRF